MAIDDDVLMPVCLKGNTALIYFAGKIQKNINGKTYICSSGQAMISSDCVGLAQS